MGRSVMRHGNGDSSHNLFGIKADERWRGDRINTSTLEYRDGVALRTSADFRAYASFEQSFSDYVDFVQRNPRYRDALGQTDDPAAYFERCSAPAMRLIRRMPTRSDESSKASRCSVSGGRQGARATPDPGDPATRTWRASSIPVSAH